MKSRTHKAPIAPRKQSEANKLALPGRRTFLAALVVVGVLIAVFGQICWHGFCSWDDSVHVTDNPYLHPVSWENLRELWLSPYRKLYIPLSYTFFAAEAEIARWINGPTVALAPAIFHAGSLLLHVLSTLLVWRILMLLTGATWPSALGALLFGVHPLQVESVAWISETRGLLSGLLSLGSIWLYLIFAGATYRQAVAENRAYAESFTPRRRRALYGLATLTFAAALLAKPSAAAVPLMLAILDRVWCRRRWSNIARSLVPWVILVVAISWITKGEQQDASIHQAAPVWARPLAALDTLSFYVTKLIAPVGLAVQYDRSVSTLFDVSKNYGYWIVLCCAAAVLWWASRRQAKGRVWLACGGIFAAGILPVSGIVPFTFQNFSWVADRYVYLAMLGPGLAVAAWLASGNFQLRAGLVTGVLVVLAGLSFVQTSLWSDDRDLYRHTLAVNPRSFIAHNHLGVLLKRDGRFDEAIGHYRQAILSIPNYLDVRYNLANALAAAKRWPEARAQYARIIERGSGQFRAHLQLARLLAREEQWDSAIKNYRKALELRPDLVPAKVGLAAALSSVGKYREAIDLYREALRKQPSLVEARFQLAWVLATCSDASLRRPHEAVELAESLTGVPPSGKAAALDTLAAALAADRQFEKAVSTAEQAIAAAQGAAQSSVRVRAMKARLALYRTGQPFIDEPQTR